MYYQEYHKKSQSVLDTIKEKYPFLFSTGFSSESVEVRYHLFEYLKKEYDYMGGLEKDQNGRPIPINIGGWMCLYWSISHSEHYVAFIISEQPTGIDISEYQERDDSLLETHTMSEYELLWGKNWDNFYILWSAKESIIKLISWKLDTINQIHLEQIISFWVYEYTFLGQSYWVQAMQEDNIFLSYIPS